MRALRFTVVLLGALASILTLVLGWAMRLNGRSDLGWFARWVTDNFMTLGYVLLGAGVSATLLNLLKDILAPRLALKAAFGKVLDDMARRHFPGMENHNRFTIYKRTSGFRVFLYSLIFIPKRKLPKRWKYLRSIRWSRSYLGVFCRPTGAANQSSSTAWLIGDEQAECEGVAGRVWASGSTVFLQDLPNVTNDDVDRISDFQDVNGHEKLSAYASKSNIRSLSGLQASRTLARHFLGTVIKRGYGSKWGVILLDSTADECTFPEDSLVAEHLQMAASLMGRFVEAEGKTL